MMINTLKAFIYIPCTFIGVVAIIDGLLPIRSITPNPTVSISQILVGLPFLAFGLYLRKSIPKPQTYKEIKQQKS